MRVELGGAAVEVEVHGSGPALVLLHGFPLSSEIWGPVLPALAEVARAIAPDLPGFGRSAAPGRAITIDGLADEVVALADALEVGRFVVAGHSMGGYVALSIAERHQERLEGLVLVDSRAEADDEAGRARRDTAIAQIEGGGRSAFLEGFVPNLVGATTRTSRARLLGDLRAIADEVPDQVLTGCLAAMRDRPDRRGVLERLEAPTLVVVGEEDTVTPPESARAIAARLRHGSLAVIAGSGHTPSVERPIALAETLVRFLAGLA